MAYVPFGAVNYAVSPAQTIGDNSFTALVFNSVVLSTGVGLQIGVNSYVDVLQGGTFAISYAVTFAASATDSRAARIITGVGGAAPSSVVLQGQFSLPAATAPNEFSAVGGLVAILLPTNATIGLEVFQDTGGDLDAIGSIQVARIG